MYSANNECRNPENAVSRQRHRSIGMKKSIVSLSAGSLSAVLLCAVAMGQGNLRAFSPSGLTTSSAESIERGTSWLQQAKLTASDGQPNDQFGFSSASGGDTVVVGMEYGNRSEVYLFVKPADGWGDMTETAKLTPSDGPISNFGYSVAVSGDTVIVGAPGADGVYVYVKPPSGWSDMTETAKLTASGSNGYAVAISGSTVVSGSAFNSGQDFLFVKPPGGWKTTSNPTTTLTTPDFGNYVCGTCVSVSGDTVAVGAPGNFIGEGTVYVFAKPKTGWPQDMNPTATLIASDAALYDELGLSVSVNRNTVVAGAPYHARVGTIYVFEKPISGWVNMTQTAKLTARDGSATGIAVGLSASGNTIVAGSPLANVGTNQAQGATYIFAKPRNGWETTKKFNAKFTASDGAENNQFGASVGISGVTTVVGAPLATVNVNYAQGAAYVFRK